MAISTLEMWEGKVDDSKIGFEFCIGAFEFEWRWMTLVGVMFLLQTTFMFSYKCFVTIWGSSYKLPMVKNLVILRWHPMLPHLKQMS
jgi:hypothetical protein